MRPPFKTLALAFGLSLIAANPAHAARGAVPGGTSYDLTPVADISAGGASITICHYTQMDHILWIGYWLTSKGYVLSDNGCTDTSYYDMPAGFWQASVAAGVIPADLPETPRFTMKQWIVGFGWFWIFGIVAAFMGLTKLRNPRRRTPAALADRMLTAMCIVARADGYIDGEETKAIRYAYGKLTGKTLDDLTIQAALSRATEADIATLAAGLNENGRQTVMRAALLVACVDGEIQEAEHRVISLMSRALVVPAPQIRTMLAGFAGMLNPPAAA